MVELRTAEAHHQTAVVKPQVHQTQSVISTNVLVLQPTTVALLAVSRETLEPTGRGKIKQPSRRRLFRVPSSRDYLVDTGASRSVFPHRSSAALTGPRLLMADGWPTKAWGSRLIPLQFGSHRFQFQFLLANMDQPILGADFLAEFNLLVDTKNRQVLQNRSFEPLANSSVASVCKLAPDVASLLDEFPAAWNARTPGKLPEHNVEHVIETEGQPLYARPPCLDQVKLAQAKAEF